MKEKGLSKIALKIRKLVYHVGTFEQNLSKIIKGASPYTRAYLVVLLDALPDIKDLIRFASKTVPAIDQINEEVLQEVLTEDE